MKCINCHKPSTTVANTRSRTKTPVVWRRRRCLACNITFSTEERPTLEYSYYVWNPKTEQSEQFNTGRLIMSIGEAFQHDLLLGKNSAWSIAQTVSDLLITKRPNSASTDDISAITYQTLKRFDSSAGLQYALKYQLIAPSKQRVT